MSIRKTIKRNLRRLGLVPPLPPKAPRPKAGPAGAAISHPLPTLNLATESTVVADGLLRMGGRAYLPFSASPEVRARVVARIADRAAQLFSELGLPRRDLIADIDDFLSTYPRNKAAGKARTTATGSLMWLHLLTRSLDPSVIVESGVFRGASLVTLMRASRRAKLFAFDIDLSNLAFRNEDRITYHEGDWSQALPRAQSPNDLCYFDDHINNCLRIRQAYDQGFRHDPNDPLGTLADYCLGCYTNNNLPQRVELLEKYMNEYQADGLLINSIKSCNSFSAGQLLMMREIEKRTGKPAAFIETDLVDPRYFSHANVKNRLESYFQMVDQKRSGASLAAA